VQQESDSDIYWRNSAVSFLLYIQAYEDFGNSPLGYQCVIFMRPEKSFYKGMLMKNAV